MFQDIAMLHVSPLLSGLHFGFIINEMWFHYSNNNDDDEEDDEDESPESKLEREKLRRQQNNARERSVVGWLISNLFLIAGRLVINFIKLANCCDKRYA